jgi:hypothetical protein
MFGFSNLFVENNQVANFETNIMFVFEGKSLKNQILFLHSLSHNGSARMGFELSG